VSIDPVSTGTQAVRLGRRQFDQDGPTKRAFLPFALLTYEKNRCNPHLVTGESETFVFEITYLQQFIATFDNISTTTHRYIQRFSQPAADLLECGRVPEEFYYPPQFHVVNHDHT
jgi:hypothetical protein